MARLVVVFLMLFVGLSSQPILAVENTSWGSIKAQFGENAPVGKLVVTKERVAGLPESSKKITIEFLSPTSLTKSMNSLVAEHWQNNWWVIYRMTGLTKSEGYFTFLELRKDGVPLGGRGPHTLYQSMLDNGWGDFSWDVGSYYDENGNYSKAYSGTGFTLRIYLLKMVNPKDYLSKENIVSFSETRHFEIILPSFD